MEKVVGFVAGKAKALLAKLTGAEQQREEPPQNAKEHDAQVSAGLAALDGEQKKQDQDSDGALTHEEAKYAAQRVKQAYPVFKRLIVVDAGDTWDYDYVASHGRRKKGFKKEKEDPVILEKDIITRLSTHEDAYLVKLGPYANTKYGSIEAQSESTTEKDREIMLVLGRKYGCHHTGNKNLSYYTPDHQAPISLFKLAKENKYVFYLLKRHGVRVHEKQRLYPQSKRESDKQGGVVSTLLQKIKKLIGLRGE